MNEAKAKSTDVLFVCNALGYRLMQLAAKRMGNEDYIRWRRLISLLFGDYTSGVRKGVWVRYCSSRRETVSSKKCRPATNNQPTNHPTYQTNQPVKRKSPSAPGWEQRMRQLETFFGPPVIRIGSTIVIKQMRSPAEEQQPTMLCDPLRKVIVIIAEAAGGKNTNNGTHAHRTLALLWLEIMSKNHQNNNMDF
jgi:hypothetical protein